VLNDYNSEINIETFEFNEALLNNDNMKIIFNDAESVKNHIDNIIPNDDINKSSLEHNNIQNNKDIINVSFEEIDTISQNFGRKRSKRANTDNWTRKYYAKCKRMRG